MATSELEDVKFPKDFKDKKTALFLFRELTYSP